MTPRRVLLLCWESKCKDAFYKAKTHWVRELGQRLREWLLLGRESTLLARRELSRCGADTANLKEARQFGVHREKPQVTFCSEKVFSIHRDSRTRLGSPWSSIPHTHIHASNHRPVTPGTQCPYLPQHTQWCPDNGWNSFFFFFNLNAMLLSGFISWC